MYLEKMIVLDRMHETNLKCHSNGAFQLINVWMRCVSLELLKAVVLTHALNIMKHIDISNL